MRNDLWVIVLAVGEEIRSSLEWAQDLVPEERVIIVVTEQHLPFWKGDLRGFPAGNLVVQPRDRATAFGILLALLNVSGRDPEARVLVLPGNHRGRDEAVLRQLLLEFGDLQEDDVTLLGTRPDSLDPVASFIFVAHSAALLRYPEKLVALYEGLPGRDLGRGLPERPADKASSYFG